MPTPNHHAACDDGAGLSFERVCLQHSRQIKAALGISGVETSESSFVLNNSGGCGWKGIVV